MRDWLDSPSGHIAVCITMIVLGAVLVKVGVAKGDDIMIFALGAMGRSMLGEGSPGGGEVSARSPANASRNRVGDI